MIGVGTHARGGLALVGRLNAWRDAASAIALVPQDSPEWLEAVAVARERRAIYDRELDAVVRAQRADRIRHPRPWAR
jgi:hypothetical protein